LKKEEFETTTPKDEKVTDQTQVNVKYFYTFSLIFDLVFLLISLLCIFIAILILKKYIKKNISTISNKLSDFHLNNQAINKVNMNLSDQDLI
jgi:hypothetical protein